MEPEAMRELVARAPVARLATVRASGEPHLVPVCFALDPDADVVFSIVDAKPKRTTALRRLDNVRAHPAVSLLVDHYDDDWTQLWWVRIDGTASVHHSGAEHARAVELLAAKYHQYREQPPAGPLLRIAIRGWNSWSAAG